MASSTKPRQKNAAAPQPAANKHQLRTEATKQKLFKAASRIFVRDGFEASSIDEIAQAAGFTRGAFYAHFSNKEDLFLALLENELAMRMKKLRAVLESAGGDKERVNVFRNHYSSGGGRNTQWSILILEFKLYAIRHAKIRAKLAGAHNRIRTKIKQEHFGAFLPSEWLTTSRENEERRILLEAVMQGLAVQQAYDPATISDTQMTNMLSEAFDLFSTRLTS
jgi:AcrR family transcriptional regulator